MAGDRDGPQVPAGQGRGELHLAQGGRGRVHPPGDARAPLWRGGNRDGVRRTRAGRLGRPQGGNLPARVPDPHRASGIPERRHHFRPEHLCDRHRNRGAQRVRGGLHRRHAAHQGHAAERESERRREQRVVLIPRQQSGARGHPQRVPVPRRRRWDGHGDRECRRIDAVHGHPARTAPAGGGRRARSPP